MKYAFVQRHRRVWPISVQCRVLRISMAGYHEHFVRKACGAQRRHLSDDALLAHIKAVHAETRGCYGWPRIWKELLARGVRVGKERVQKLMQLHGIRARGKRRFKVTTDSRHVVIDALRMAWFKRHPGKQAGLIFHSDRGSQYASYDFRTLLAEYGITSSMSRKGNCWDNACSETLFGSLKGGAAA